jgi:CRP-like cAMP-binding protein
MAERRFSNDEYIFKAGDPADGVFRIRAGKIRLSRDGRSGLPGGERRAPGEIFGDDGFLTGDARDSDARAVDDVSVDFLRRTNFWPF